MPSGLICNGWSGGSKTGLDGVYCIFPSMEVGSKFDSKMPKFPTDDPNYRIIQRGRSRYLHYYFYIRDPVIGPLAMCVGTYLPFQTKYYLNGHNFIEIELRRQGVAFRKNDNAFLSTADPEALQAAAHKLSAATIEKRLNYWSWLLGPKFSEKDRKAVNLRREYSINQIEYCRNFIFKRHFPIHKIFEHSCEMGLFRPTADKVARIFGVRVTKRLNGKLHSVLEKLDHGHHVMRIYCKKLVGRMYEKFSTFLRVEVCVNRMMDRGLNKGLENLQRLRQKLVAITDRFAGFEAQSLNVHVDFPLFQRIALPVMAGKTKIAGIKIHDTRMMRLMEALLHGGTQLNGWLRSLQLAAFNRYTEQLPPVDIQVSSEQIRTAGGRPDQWLTYSGSLDGHRYTPLTEITPENVSRLRVRWIRQFGTSDSRGESTPIVVGGVIFTTQPFPEVVAVDARSESL